MDDLLPAWSNAIAATLNSPFTEDLTRSVSNGDFCPDTGIRYLLTLTVNFLRQKNQPHSPIDAFDFARADFENIGRVWPVFHKAINTLEVDRSLAPILARFVADRLPSIWDKPKFIPHPPVTQAVILAEKTHDLVALFSVGLKPNGSKDPYALRRAANHWLLQVVNPFTVGLRQN